MEGLKPSMFNMEFMHDGLRYIYNTRTTTLAEIDAPLAECITKTAYIPELVEGGFVVGKEDDEVNSLLQSVDTRINRVQDTLELTIVLTETCNFHCIYCYQTKKHNEFSANDVHEIVEKIGLLFDEGLNSLLVHYFGGEPLLNFPILQLLDKSFKELCEEKHKIFQSYITTNGSLLTKEILNELCFNTIQLTFDGDSEIHSQYKVSKTFGYRDLLETISTVLTESVSNLRIRFNICKENADSFIHVLDDIFSLSSFDINRINFAFNPMRNFFGVDSFTELSPLEYSKVNLRLRRHVLALGKKLILPKSNDQPCKFAVGNAICIGPQAKLYFCTSDFAQKAKRNAVEDFLRPQSVRYSLHEICSKCTVLPICLCSCKLLNPERNACIPEKYILVDILKMYLDQPDMWES